MGPLPPEETRPRAGGDTRHASCKAQVCTEPAVRAAWSPLSEPPGPRPSASDPLLAGSTLAGRAGLRAPRAEAPPTAPRSPSSLGAAPRAAGLHQTSVLGSSAPSPPVSRPPGQPLCAVIPGTGLCALCTRGAPSGGGVPLESGACPPDRTGPGKWVHWTTRKGLGPVGVLPRVGH